MGPAHDGPPHGDALPLTAGKLARLAVEEFGDVENLGRRLDPLANLRGGNLLHLQTEGQVLEDGQMRIEGVVLEHHGDVPVLRRQLVDDFAVDGDLAAGDILQAGDHPQDGALAAAGGADQNDEFIVLDVQVDAVNHLEIAETFHDFSKFQTCHSFLLSLRRAVVVFLARRHLFVSRSTPPPECSSCGPIGVAPAGARHRPVSCGVPAPRR